MCVCIERCLTCHKRCVMTLLASQTAPLLAADARPCWMCMYVIRGLTICKSCIIILAASSVNCLGKQDRSSTIAGQMFKMVFCDGHFAGLTMQHLTIRQSESRPDYLVVQTHVEALKACDEADANCILATWQHTVRHIINIICTSTADCVTWIGTCLCMETQDKVINNCIDQWSLS